MKILFLFLNFDVDKENLYTDLVKKFKEENHEIYVANIIEKKYNKETYIENKKGIKNLKIKTGNMFNVNYIEKGITTLTLGNVFKSNIEKYWGDIKFDLVIHSTPPITFTPVIKWLKKKYSTKSYLILRDIFPQNAKDLGILNNKLLFNYFRKKEKNLYKNSDYIGCMSQGNIDYVLKENPEIQKEKLHILRNWGKIKEKSKIDKDKIRTKYNFFKDDFIVVFGGNMGKPQGLEFLLELAKEYTEKKEIKFLFVGKGNEKNNLIKIKNNFQLDNVIFLEFIPREEYELLIGACDIGIVSLCSDFTIPNIPSKTVDYCKLSLPILACVDKNTDYPKILEEEAKCGMSSIYGDLKKYKENFEKLYNNKDLRIELGKNGRKYYEEYLGVDKAYKTIIEELK